MRPKQMHQEAMNCSFEAKQAFASGNDLLAGELYVKAAEIESELARYYFDKPELEPTRSAIVRSAAFLNLKAGRIEEARQFIFWGLLNLTDETTREQLNEALEISVALRNIHPHAAGINFEYFSVLRQRSVHYTLEPASHQFGSVISLEMLRDFADDYLKSLKAFAASSFRRIDSTLKVVAGSVEEAARAFEDLANPLITASAIGSFRFSLANDFLGRGEQTEIVRLKAAVVVDYHERIFTNPLEDTDIIRLKEEYKDEEINEIFRPVTRIKSTRSPYKVAYFDTDNFYKKYLPRVNAVQKRKLLPPKLLPQEDIGFLESLIFHARPLDGGRKSRSLIQREQLKSYEFEFKTGEIAPKDHRPLPLREEINITVLFDADKGFTFVYEDLDLEHTATAYSPGLQAFYGLLYDRILEIVNTDAARAADRNVVARLLTNPESLRR